MSQSDATSASPPTENLAPRGVVVEARSGGFASYGRGTSLCVEKIGDRFGDNVARDTKRRFERYQKPAAPPDPEATSKTRPAAAVGVRARSRGAGRPRVQRHVARTTSSSDPGDDGEPSSSPRRWGHILQAFGREAPCLAVPKRLAVVCSLP